MKRVQEILIRILLIFFIITNFSIITFPRNHRFIKTTNLEDTQKEIIIPKTSNIYINDFEGLISASTGIILTGQDGFFKEGPDSERLDFKVYTYTGNSLGFNQNPTGGNNFIAGIQSGSNTWAVVKHDVNFDGGLWEIEFDFAMNFNGILTGFGLDDYHAGGFWLRPYESIFDVTMGWGPENEHGYYEPEHIHVLYEAYDESGSIFIGKPSDWIFNMPGETPGPEWENLPKNRWYKISTKVDFDTNKICSLLIKDIETGDMTMINPSNWYLRGGAAGGLSLPSYFMLAAGIIWPSPSNPFPEGVGSMMAFDNIKLIRRPENPELTSPTHSKGQISCERVLIVEWETPYACGEVGGYSYTIVNQDDPFYNEIREPDDVIDLNTAVTSFSTQPLEPGHIWEFNIKTIDSEGLSAEFYSSFWVEIDSCSVVITRPRIGDFFKIGEWVNVYWEPVTYGGINVGGAYDVDTIDLFKGGNFIMMLLSNLPNILSVGFIVPDVDLDTNYNIRIVLKRNSVGDMFPELPERLIGFSGYFAIGVIVVFIMANDNNGHFSVNIDAGEEIGAPVTSWIEISTSNIELYSISLMDGDMIMFIEGYLLDPSNDGEIILDVDPNNNIIRWEVHIRPYETIDFGLMVLIIILISICLLILREKVLLSKKMGKKNEI
ncbi:MAG: hypothetical protein ACFE9V_20275 [Candidatus Hodarchaeota archaeon]